MADEATGTAILHEETLRELGLSEQPFVDGKKPHRFTDSAMQKTRASLEQQVRFGESVHLVLGDTGAGKTVLLSQLIKHCKNTVKPFVAKGSEGFVAEAFLTAVLNQLGGEQSDTMTGLVDSLAPEFSALHEQQFSVLLAIDDAHLAPVEEISELINVMSEFNANGEITTRLLLTGEAKLKSSLDAIAREYDGMNFDPTVSTVPALTEAQMRDYLSSRLNHAGHTDVFPFTEKALTKLHRESTGLPLQINKGAAHYLNTVYANATADKAGGGLIATLGWPLVALGTAAVGLIAWGLSMFIGGGNDSNQVVTAKPPTIVANTAVEIKLVDDETLLPAQSEEDLDSAIKELATTDLQNGADNTGDTLLQPTEQQLATTTQGASTQGASDSLQSSGNAASEIANSPASAEPLEQDAAASSDTLLTRNTESVDNSVNESTSADIQEPTQTAEQTTEQLTEQVTTRVTNAQEPALEQQIEQQIDEQIDNSAVASSQQEADSNATQGLSAADTTETIIASSDSTLNSQAGSDSAGSDSNSASPPQVPESQAVGINNLADDNDAISVNNSEGGVTVALPSVSDNTNAQDSTTIEQSESSVPVATPRAVENERWVLFQEPTHFTVQLATSRERNYILELAQGLSESPVAIYPFRTTASQNPVFGLLSGLYETRTEALNAVEEMPSDVKRFGVWIRPISDLQAAIKNNPQ